MGRSCRHHWNWGNSEEAHLQRRWLLTLAWLTLDIPPCPNRAVIGNAQSNQKRWHRQFCCIHLFSVLGGWHKSLIQGNQLSKLNAYWPSNWRWWQAVIVGSLQARLWFHLELSRVGGTTGRKQPLFFHFFSMALFSANRVGNADLSSCSGYKCLFPHHHTSLAPFIAIGNWLKEGRGLVTVRMCWKNPPGTINWNSIW